MGDFSADWLALREPADAAARSSTLIREVADRLSGRPSIKALDLAAGTGSNVRHLADQLTCDQDWLLVDRDVNLLAQVGERMSSWSAARRYHVELEGGGWLVRGERLSCRIATRSLELETIGPDLFEGRDLVSASALLDLVSDSWLDLLTSRCRQSGSAVLFALSYDGRLLCSPVDEEDGRIQELVNRHQRTDKGFGDALGPAAAARCDDRLARLGYHVVREQSDWILEQNSDELQRQLIDGWSRAAAAMARDQSLLVEQWRARRLEHIRRRRSRISVGHQDLAAWLD